MLIMSWIKKEYLKREKNRNLNILVINDDNQRRIRYTVISIYFSNIMY